MPRFSPDLENATATIPELEGLYQIQLYDPTGFVREGRNGVIAGVRYKIKTVGEFDSNGELDRSIEDRPASPVTFWVHTPKTEGMNKRAFMAILGYTPNAQGEREATEEIFSQHEFTVEGEVEDEVVTISDGWHLLDGRVVNVNASIQDDGEYRNQDYSNWAPVSE